MYLIRLDDASEYMDFDKWARMEAILDKYGIKPIFGIIPANEDESLLKYGKVDGFWDLMQTWIEKDWTPALHGYTHVFETEDGGINPINKKSEFAGVPYEKQAEKIKKGYTMLKEHGVDPGIFFAPAHTFDRNTVKALVAETNVRIISDTVADDVYYEDGIYYIPQQSGSCRKLPFKIVTFCYHPNTLTDEGFINLEHFLEKHAHNFVKASDVVLKKRKLGLLDRLYRKWYFMRRK